MHRVDTSSIELVNLISRLCFHVLKVHSCSEVAHDGGHCDHRVHPSLKKSWKNLKSLPYLHAEKQDHAQDHDYEHDPDPGRSALARAGAPRRNNLPRPACA